MKDYTVDCSGLAGFQVQHAALENALAAIDEMDNGWGNVCACGGDIFVEIDRAKKKSAISHIGSFPVLLKDHFLDPTKKVAEPISEPWMPEGVAP